MADAQSNEMALNTVQPNVDLTGPLKSVAQIEMMQNQGALYGAQARYQMMRQNALAQAAAERAKGNPNWMDSIAAVDPATAKDMQSYDWTQQEHQAGLIAGQRENAGDQVGAQQAVAGYPAVRDTIAKAFQATTAAQQTQLRTNMEAIGQSSQAFLDAYAQYQKDGDIDALRRVWNRQSTSVMQHGAMNQFEYNAMYDLKSPQAIDMAVRKAREGQMYSVATKDYFESGEGARRTAEARLPSELKKVEAEGVQRRETQADKPIAAPATDIITRGRDIFGHPQSQGVNPNQGDTTTQQYPPGNAGQIGSDLPQYTVPHLQIGTNDPRFAVQGVAPQDQDRIKNAADHYDKDVRLPGMMAYGQRSSLNEMENLLLQGHVSSNASAEIREQAAGWIYAIMGGGGSDDKANAAAMKAARDWTGIDLKDQPTFNKFTTQMGLQYARATEGAREAVQAIRIALGANPQAGNPREANLQIIRLMKAANQYSIDKMDYENQYYQQNKHYVGAEEEFSRQRTPEMYTSRVNPFPVPTNQAGQTDTRRLQPNVAYTYRNNRTGQIEYGSWNGRKFMPMQF